MKTLDMLAKSCEAAAPTPAADPLDMQKLSGDVIDRVARRVIEIMSEAGSPEPEPEPQPEPDPIPEPEGGAEDESRQPGPVG